LSLEWHWLQPAPTEPTLASNEAQNLRRPPIVFLHEGLGSVSMWRDFPQRLCNALQAPGLVYSRPGYGQSTPRTADEHWAPDFMHQQAQEVLPLLLKALRVQGPVWLFGHSDGGSIALLAAAHAASAADALEVAGVVALAPHLFVEDLSIRSIERTREAYTQGDLRQRLARHHANPDSAFWGWNGIWLAPAFRPWNIEAELAGVRCPVLAIQGLDDEYGTPEQIHALQRCLPQTRSLLLPDCGHSPHRDQPEQVIEAVQREYQVLAG
jgi:pimeloyl-ACP methyl ester carboxylesterase